MKLINCRKRNTIELMTGKLPQAQHNKTDN